jgi:hypothetical protein
MGFWRGVGESPGADKRLDGGFQISIVFFE